MTDAQAASGSGRVSDDRFLDHLSSAAEMVGARRFREAEVEVLRALSITPSDLRGLKLLALVRFKLGRLEEARALCREIASAAPNDAGVRLKLGLIALKLDRLDESVSELELAARLAPGDLRPWSYLGFAYARRGQRARAAAAFRRAGAEAMAAELEVDAGEQRPEPRAAVPLRVEGDGSGARASTGYGSGRAIISPGALPSTTFEPAFDLSLPIEARAIDDRETREAVADVQGTPGQEARRDESARELPLASLVGFAMGQLAPEGGAAPGLRPSELVFDGSTGARARDATAWFGSASRLAIDDGAFVRGDAALACAGRVRWEPALRHVRGRPTGDRLGADTPFFRVQGKGELFVTAPVGRLVALRLEDDILYVREDAVVAFEATVSWEYGHIPRAPIGMLQFRGRGLVTLCVRGETGAVKVTPERPLQAAPRNLLGWVGQVVARGGAAGPDDPAQGEGPLPITCEGEGVVFFQVNA